MGKRLSLAGVIGVILTALTVAPAAAATTSTVTSCIASGSAVCAAPGSSISDPGKVESALQGKAAVAVVPDDGSNSLNPNQLATQIAQDGGKSELILVVDMARDRYGVYSESGKTEEILAALNGTGEFDGGKAIVDANIGSLYSQSTPVETADGTGAGPLAILIPGVVLLAAVGAGVGFILKRRRKPEVAAAQQAAKANRAADKSVQLSDELREQLNRLSNTAERYRRSGNSELLEASELISTLLTHIYELFRRIDKKNSRQYRELAQVRYLDTSQKLNGALSEDYFEYIVKSPSFWDSSEEKKTAVLSALRSVDRQVVENIKQVNSSKEIEFKVAMESLIDSDEPGPEEKLLSDDGSPSRGWG